MFEITTYNSQEVSKTARLGAHNCKVTEMTKENTLIIENANDTTEIELNVGQGLTIDTIIDRFYDKLGRPRQPEDRLTCSETGTSIFEFIGSKLKDAMAAGLCPDLHWTFAGTTGGA